MGFMRAAVLALLLCSLLTSCALFRRDPDRKEERSVFTRWIPSLPGFGGGGDRAERKRGAALRRMEMDLSVQPQPLKLSEVRRLDVSVRLTSRGRSLVQLQFPSAQRIEVLILDEAGAKVTQWSDDQLFAQVQSYLTINPGERVQYDVKLATRDLTAGRTYTVEAFVPGYEQLKKRLTLEVQP